MMPGDTASGHLDLDAICRRGVTWDHLGADEKSEQGPQWAQLFRYDTAALLAEVERLRADRTLTLNMDHLAALARLQEEIERLRDGIRNEVDHLWRRHREAGTVARLRALLDDRTETT